MTSSPALLPSNATAAELADIIEKLTVRMKSGEPIGPEELASEYPDHASALCRLLPTMQLMANLSASVAPDSDRPAAESPLCGILGDFRLIREVGHGGMGIVYEAEQISLNRKVALKVLPFAATMDPRQLQRFKNEAQAAACLHHPNIVPVYGVGCERGVHYYAMQLIEGQTLAEVIQPSREPERPEIPERASQRERDVDLPAGDSHVALTLRRSPSTAPLALLSTKRDRAHFRSIAEIVASAADALEYAHSMGVVHRDIKPGNLMLDSSGHLWVADFGLAKLGTSEAITMTGDLIGTLRYMSPEQALAKHGLVDHRTDIYSLGATLYELLTLQPAVQGADKAEILKHIAFEEPTPLRKLDKSIPAELETITLKCLAKEPGERYATAREVAEDLRRWLTNRVIQARPPGYIQRLTRLTRRHAIAVVVGSTALLIGTIASAVLGLVAQNAWWRAEADRELARAAERNAATSAAITSAINTFFHDDLLHLVASDVQANLGLVANPNLTVKEALDRAAAKVGTRFPDQPLVEAAIRHTIGDAYWRLGKSEKAIPHLARSVALKQAELGPDDEDTLFTANTLASAYLYAGRVDQAVAQFQQNLARQQATLGPDHEDTITTEVNLGEAFGRMGRPREAIPVLERALLTASTKLGPDHLATFCATGNLATRYVDVGRTTEGIALLEKALANQKFRLVDDHPSMLNAMTVLAKAYRQARRLPDALHILESVVPKAQRRLGPDHVNTIMWTEDLGLGYLANHQWDKARKQLERVLEFRRSRLRTDDPQTLRAVINVGSARFGSGQCQEVIDLFEAELGNIQTVFGSEGANALVALNTLAMAYQNIGRARDAIPLLERVLRQRRVDPGPEHPDTLQTELRLSGAYVDVGRYGDTIALLAPKMSNLEVVLGPDHHGTLDARNTLAEAYRRSGQVERALPLHEKNFKLAVTALGCESALASVSANNLALNYYAVGRLADADALLEPRLAGADKTAFAAAQTHIWLARRVATPARWQKVVGLWEEIARRRAAKNGPNHADTLTAQLWQAEALDGAGQWDSGAELAKVVVAGREKLLGQDHPETLDALRRLEGLYRRAGRWADDEAVVHELVRRTIAKFGPNHSETWNAQRDWAFVLFNTNRLDEAVSAYERIRDAEAAKYGVGSPATLGTLNMLAITYHFAGRLDDADRLGRECLSLNRKSNGPMSDGTGQALAFLGMNLLARGKFSEAESALREATAILEKQPNPAWQRGRVRNLYGAALAGVGKPAEAERLLIEGFEAMKRDEATIPAPWKRYLIAAGRNVERFYETTNQPEKARAFREKLKP